MKAYLAFIISLIIFGTIGLFVRFIDLSSCEIALFRGIIGIICLSPIIIFKPRIKSFFSEIQKYPMLLIISGFLLAGNWIFLFEAYRNTSIAVAALLYYTAPIFVLLLSIFILGERITIKKICLIGITLIGMLLLSNIRPTENIHLHGVIFSTAGALCYAGLMVVNKLIKNIRNLDSTASQLAIASLILMPYTIYSNNFSFNFVGGKSLVLLIIMGVVHTGIGFFMFFYGIKHIKVHKIAFLGYIDPIVSVLISFIVFKETLTEQQIIGAIIICITILFSTLDLPIKNTKSSI